MILTPYASTKDVYGDEVVPSEYLLMFETCLRGLVDPVTTVLPNEELSFQSISTQDNVKARLWHISCSTFPQTF